MKLIKENLMKIIVFIAFILIFTVVGSIVNKDEDTEKAEKQVESKETTAKETEKKPADKTDTIKEDKNNNNNASTSNIDTSGFIYAESVEVTDALSTNNHFNFVVHMPSETVAGLATQHVFRQSYDLLQQNEVKKAKTVTIGVMQGEKRIAQITVNVDKFTPGENYIDSVLNASKIDKMIPEVQEFGKNMELW